MQMHLLELFPTIVGVFACDTFDRDGAGWRALVAAAIAERESKLGTPQHQTDDRLHERADMASMVDFLRQCAAEYMAGLGYRSTLELRVQSCWASTLVHADRFEMHQHANSFLSGAFYLEVSAGANPIRFRDPRPQARTMDVPVDTELRINRRYYEVEAGNGQLVLFPSWLEHRVRASYADVSRTSVSFNATLHGDVGSPEELTRATL
jgi:uncharacterized protein (TIGR02466 family)